MKVDFLRGFLKSKTLGKVPKTWACTPHGILAPDEGPPYELLILNESDVIVDHTITTVDLTGLDEDLANEVIRNILQGGYLDKPGVKDKGDAVLFMLVNEAIQVLESVAEELW
jgi:hypothetical protein